MNDQTANSPEMLQEAAQAIRQKFPHLPLGESIAAALRTTGVSAQSAEVLGARIEQIVAAGAEVPIGSKEAFRVAVAEIAALVEIDASYDIPLLAGYSAQTARKVYLDRGLKREHTLASGRRIDVTSYLVLHEVVEKSLLDACKFTERAYLHTHQIAQQLEETAVLADDIPWPAYQYDICVPAIDYAYTKRAERVPPDLDITPYRDLSDLDLLPPVKAPFELSELGSGIYHLRFKNAGRMAAAMMRFQEYYESPVYRGRFFSRAEFVAWYSNHKDGATYVEDWAAGFNIPSSALEPFYAGHFAPLTADEEEVLAAFRDRAQDRFYIIATAEDANPSLLRHEIAHALYFINPEYAREVKEVLAKIDTAPIRNFLTTHPAYALYHEAVLDDEIHAYLAHSSEELRAHGVVLEPFADTIAALGALYERHAPPSRG